MTRHGGNSRAIATLHAEVFACVLFLCDISCIFNPLDIHSENIVNSISDIPFGDQSNSNFYIDFQSRPFAEMGKDLKTLSHPPRSSLSCSLLCGHELKVLRPSSKAFAMAFVPPLSWLFCLKS